MTKLNFRCFFCTVTNLQLNIINYQSYTIVKSFLYCLDLHSLLYSTPLGVVVVAACGSLTTGNYTKKGNLIHITGIVFGKQQGLGKE